MNWRINKIAEICDGEIFNNSESVIINGFSNDTRTIIKGEVYIGVKGETFDGNLFYEEAFKKGASAALLNKEIKSSIPANFNGTIIFVEDTIEALTKLASSWLNEKNPIVIGVTGSVGKTSTRDMIYEILNQEYSVFKSIKNYNNHLGLPLSILKIKDEKFAVLEMGMNHLGEISHLTKLAKPDVAIITNVYPVHIEYLKTIDNILKAKLEIIDGLKEDGLLVINNDNEPLENANINFKNILKCGINPESDLQITKILPNQISVEYQDEELCFDHPDLTKPLLQNLLLAIAVGLKYKLSVKQINEGIQKLTLSEGRLENIKLKNDILLINDAYNANTESMKNAIDYLNKQNGKRKIAIFGNLREVGSFSKELHSEVGKYINSGNLDYLITIGSEAEYIYNEATIDTKAHFTSKDELYPFLINLIKPKDIIIVKASNGENFTEIIDFFKNKFR